MPRMRMMPLKALFRDGSEEAVVVLRLAAATNDMRSAIRIFFAANDLDESKHDLRRRAAGDRLYALRMGASHLAEALRAFQSPAANKFFAVRSSREALAERARAYRRRMDEEKFRQLVALIRNKVGAHYDAKTFREALRNEATARELIEFGDGMELHQHLDCADVVFWSALGPWMSTHYHGLSEQESIVKALGELAELQQELTGLVYSMIGVLMEERRLI